MFAFMAGAAAQDAPPAGATGEAVRTAPTPELDPAAIERIEFERIRAGVESALSVMDAIPDDRVGDSTLAIEVRDRLVALGPGVVPFLESEAFGVDPARASFSLYTLGKVRTPESAAVLERAVKKFDGDAELVPMRLAQTAIIALACHGRVDALTVLDGLESDVARMGHFKNWSTLVTVSALLGPSARPHLLDALDTHAEAVDDRSKFRLAETLEALARIPSPEILPRVAPFLAHPAWRVRRAAVAAVGAIGTPPAVDLLLARIRDADEDSRVRSDAAIEIERLQPVARLDEILALLETLEPATSRNFLYRTIARIGGDRAVPALRSHRGRPDRLDRSALIAAAALTRDTRALGLIREGIADPDGGVAIQAVRAISEIPGAGARETLLAALNDPRWTIRSTAIDRLIALDERRAAPRISDRLIRDELGRAATKPETRGVVRTYGEALVAFRDATAVEDIRGKIDRQGDPELRAYLRGLVARLDAIRELGSDVAAWSARTGHEDVDLRRLAVDRLAEIGSPPALEALASALAAGDREDRLAIVQSIARRSDPRSAPLLERVLLQPEFDIADGPRLRSWAAWAAQRIGTRDMADVLERAVDRRRGLDADVVRRLALVRGSAAAERIDAYRHDRLEEFDWLRGEEQDVLDRIARDVRAGRDLASHDGEPHADGRLH